MLHWMRLLAGKLRNARRRAPAQRPRDRRASVSLEGALLERREVLSAAGGVPFASVGGFILKPNRPQVITFRVEPGKVVSDRSVPTLLGLDAEPLPGSTVEPKVVRIVALGGRTTTGIPTTGGPLLTHIAIPVTSGSVYQVKVIGREGTTGPYVLNAFLPGDVDGDGIVDRVDLARVRFGYGSHVGHRRYTPAADFNNDGKIGHVDLGLTRRNLGSRASIVVLSQGTPARA